MGQHLSPRYGQVILVSGYPALTAVNWSKHWCTICVQYQSSCANKLARKCEIEHWFSCAADGRAGCGRCTVTWFPNFLGWVDLLTHGAPQARSARQSSAINDKQLRTSYAKSWVSLTERWQNVVIGGGSSTMSMWRTDMFEKGREIIRTMILTHFVYEKFRYKYDVAY